MIRVVLVEWSDNEWRVFRQEQWMAEVRRDPSASGFSRLHFDIAEEEYRTVVETWAREAHGSNRRSAIDRLVQAGAIEIGPR